MFSIIERGAPYPEPEGFDPSGGFVKLRFRDFEGQKHGALIEGTTISEETFDKAIAEAVSKGAVRGHVEALVTLPSPPPDVMGWIHAVNVVERPEPPEPEPLPEEAEAEG